jgi:hypothetical protein
VKSNPSPVQRIPTPAMTNQATAVGNQKPMEISRPTIIQAQAAHSPNHTSHPQSPTWSPLEPENGPLPWLPPDQHARALLDWLRKNGHRSDLRYLEILPLYERMCREKDWRVRAWSPVAREFAKITTGGRKFYRQYYDHTGAVVRLRIYPFAPDEGESSTFGHVPEDFVYESPLPRPKRKA